MSNIIQSLWIGGDLSKMERLSIKSFLDNNHVYHLYTYGEVKNVPEGAIIKDGNEILDKKEIFYYKNGSVSAFSNLFRFALMYKKGGYWVDTDIICVKPFQFKEKFVICSEPNNNYTKSIITSSLLKFEKGSKEALEGLNLQLKNKAKILSGEIQWSAGPLCVKMIVEKFNLYNYVLPWKVLCNCNCKDAASIVNPSFKPYKQIISRIEEIPKEMVCIHLWNEIWRREKIDKNAVFHEDSLYEKFKKKHNIN